MCQFLIIFISLFQTGTLTDTDRLVPDYGFIAYLFSSHNTSVKCTGAIITDSWILSYCEYGNYIYDSVRVGVSKPVARSRIKDFIYDLDERVSYQGHTISPFPQIDDVYDLSSLYASTHALFLDHTRDKMELNQADAVWPIRLSRTSVLDAKAYAHFFSQADARSDRSPPRHREMAIVNNSVCDNQFRKYNLVLESQTTQFCVDSSKVTFEDCCANHAIMESNQILIGLLAWSTACWNPPDPWVFTNLGWYYDWITNITSWDPLFPQTTSETRVVQKIPPRHRKSYISYNIL